MLTNIEEEKLKEEFLIRFSDNFCKTYITCANVRIYPEVFDKWYKEDLDFKHKVDFLRGKLGDLVEIQLIKEAIKKNNPKALEFLLKSKYKERGYTDKLEAKEEEKIKNEINIVLDTKTYEEMNKKDKEYEELLKEMGLENNNE